MTTRKTNIENLEFRRLLAVDTFGAPSFVAFPNVELASEPISYYDISDVGESSFGGFGDTPAFSIGGYEDSPNNNDEDPFGIATNPANGDTYVLSGDSGNAGDVDNGTLETDGDYDLYRFNFAAAYNDFVTNSRAPGVLYFPTVGVDGYDYLAVFDQFNIGTGPTGLPNVSGSDLSPAFELGIPEDRDNSDLDPSNDIVFLPGVVEKIAEIPRAQPTGTGTQFFDSSSSARPEPATLQFIDADTLLFLEQIAEDGVDGATDDNFVPRTIERVSTDPGFATDPSSVDPFLDPQLLGGYNGPGVSESWNKYELDGFINLDGTFPADSFGIRYVTTPDFVGFWASDDDGPTMDNPEFKDELGLYELDLSTRTFVPADIFQNTDGGTFNPTNRFQLDEDPAVSTTSNDGDLANFDVDENGNLIIVESGFFDGEAPSVQFVPIDYVNGIIGTPTKTAVTFPDDDANAQDVDGRFSVFDRAKDHLYIFDNDFSGAGSVSDVEDVYVIDINTQSLVYSEVDGLNNIFPFIGSNVLRTFTFGDSFLQDGLVTADDVDTLYAGVNGTASEQEALDLTGDDVVTLGSAVGSDAAVLIQTLIGTSFADFNVDGTVDLADFGRLRSGFGSSSLFSQGNANGDGNVDLADFGILRANFGFNANDESLFA
ncbi:MAG: hypothetical protein AAGI46_16065 [Planctomycetota bacterium]